MGTRSGDIDPSLVAFLANERNLSVDQVTDMLNRQSGLLGMTGSNDMRDVHARAERGDTAAILALKVYAHQIRHYLGAYMIELGGLDILSFTAGVGENNAAIRALVCTGLEAFGITLDARLNESSERGIRRISTAQSPVQVLVVPTDEELEIARQTLEITA